MGAVSLSSLEAYLKDKLASKLVESSLCYGELTILVAPQDLLKVLLFLRDDSHCGFIGFIDVSAADYPEREQRFEIIYHLLAPHHNLRIRVKTRTDENTPIPSCCVVYAGAEWYEREIFDLFGVYFTDHPDMRRILTDYGFSGHPLRKDFPTTGFVECRYDNEVKRVVYEPVLLNQEMRSFDFLTPWQGPDYPEPKREAQEKLEGSNG